MGLGDTEQGWGWVTRALHWVMAALILFMLGLGFYMANVKMDLMVQFELVQTHKSWGFVVFTLALIRVGWRLTRRASPPPPAATARWEASAARLSHALLYVLMFAMPLSGWLMASASPMQEAYSIENLVFGVFAMPDPFNPGDAGLEGLFRGVHIACALALSLLLVVHAAAALRHHFVHRNNILTRMITGR